MLQHHHVEQHLNRRWQQRWWWGRWDTQRAWWWGWRRQNRHWHKRWRCWGDSRAKDRSRTAGDHPRGLCLLWQRLLEGRCSGGRAWWLAQRLRVSSPSILVWGPSLSSSPLLKLRLSRWYILPLSLLILCMCCRSHKNYNSALHVPWLRCVREASD